MKFRDQKKLDDYLEEMMGTPTDEQKKEIARAGLKNLGLEKLVSNLMQKMMIDQIETK
jgi:hypothetical protein